MPQFHANHLIINGRTQTFPYISNTQGRSPVIPRPGLNRSRHGLSIIQQFEKAVADFERNVEDEFVHLVFKSPPDFLLDLQKLEDGAGNFRLKSYKQLIENEDGDGSHFYYEATVYLNRKAIGKFLSKADEYINKNTRTGNPAHQSLIANIEEIRAATLQSFWQEPALTFPSHTQNQWWEIWLTRADNNELLNDPISIIRNQIIENQIQVVERFLSFPEHFVFLMKGTAEQLAKALLYNDMLAEIRIPCETADFFTYLPIPEQKQWVDDLALRVDYLPNNISICLLDTGVTTGNPLLRNLILPENLTAVEPHWQPSDYMINGHGTPMAGLALYGDLTELLVSGERIQIYHKLESVKILNGRNGRDPDFYGAVTQEAVARAEFLNQNHKRIYCMAVTSAACIHKGRPSSWSGAIDQLVYGDHNNPNTNALFLISAGNLDHPERLQYPLTNDKSSIEDPAQAFNAITVGAYTLKDRISQQRYPGAVLLAQRGALSPSSRTSVDWDSQWCRKPDIVMEGGNNGIYQTALLEDDALQLLSTSKGGLGHSSLIPFADTSASTALASRFCAQLYREYPNLWPETIRGLTIHSADWTPAMLGNLSINQLSLTQKQALFSKVGYGVPNIQKARSSANSSLSLIVERTLKPYKLDGSIIKTDEFHLFDLPWPAEALGTLFNTYVKLKITLSYFIEPNPGNRQYQLAESYRSHGLRFKMIDRNERKNAFVARVSKAMRDEDYESEGGEHWILGDRIRNKGSIHKDLWEGPAVELAARNIIAVYPVGGWWRSRKKMGRYNKSVRYSLVVTIDAPDTILDIDIYTPVLNQIVIDIPV